MDFLNEEFLLFLKCARQTKLRYMLIGGYAVNYYGYNRNTDDLDVWLAPTNENRDVFIKTLQCMGYTEQETAPLYQEDFTTHFLGSIGANDTQIDILTIVHRMLSFEEAEKNMESFEITPGVYMQIVPYEFLKDMKLRSNREKDLFDITRLEELRNLPDNP
ncbi:MAG: hypothetical protein JNM88_02855 [Chitinophagaceae bacterium]|nr:hypothetical protein [Chitinophagaceae bacterium]